MKKTVILALILAAVLTVTGLVLRHHDPSTAFTESRAAWKAFEEGDRLLKAFRFAEARSVLQQAIDLDRHLAPAHAALAELDQTSGHPDRSKDHLAIADSLAASIGNLRGRVLLQLRLSGLSKSRYHAGRDSLLQLARSLAPREIDVLASEARRASEENDWDSVEATWKEVLSINPNYANAYNYLGYLYLGQGRYAEAEVAMRRYAFVAPDLANPHDSLGEVLMTVGRYEEAEQEFFRALDKQDEFYFSQWNLAFLYLARGQVQRAVDIIDLLLKEFAGTMLERSFERRVIYHLFDHRLADLLAVYAARHLDHETDPRSRALVEIQLLLSQASPMAALAHLDSLHAEHEASSRYPDDSMIDKHVQFSLLRYRALAAEQLGLHEAAVELLQEALDLADSFPPHTRLLDWAHLAYNLIPLERLDEARAWIRQILAVNPRHALGLLIAASIEAAAGLQSEALRFLETLEQSLSKADDDFPALLDAKRLKEQLGDPDHI